MKLIETEADYDAALAQAETLMDAKPDSPEEQTLAGLAKLLDEYEQVHHPIGPPDPIEAIKFHLEQESLNSREVQVQTAALIAAIGGAEQVGGSVHFGRDADPWGQMFVYPESISVHLYHVSSLLASTIAEMVHREREENK